MKDNPDCDFSNFCLSMPVRIQSGGVYGHDEKERSDENLVSFDTILMQIGVEYAEINTAIERTMIINPEAEQRANYKFLEETFEVMLQELKPGAKASSIYKAVRSFISQEKGEDFCKAYLPSSLGFGIGYKTHEKIAEITADNENRLVEG